MSFNLNKYRYAKYTDVNGKATISARSTYAGRTVKGYAKCDPRDQFNEEAGKALAAARCNLKIAEKRRMNAAKRQAEAVRMVEEANAYLARMNEYVADSCAAVTDAQNTIETVLAQM